MEHRRMADGTVVVDDHDPNDALNDKTDRPSREVSEIREVRATDIEPYTGLRYLSKLFRFMAVIMVLLLVAEIATGMYTQGSAAIPTLLGEASRLIVLAGVLWGTGDLAHLLIDVGHDVRAARIIAARMAHAAKLPPLGSSNPSLDHGSPEKVGAVRPGESGKLADRAVSRARFADLGGEDEGSAIR